MYGRSLPPARRNRLLAVAGLLLVAVALALPFSSRVSALPAGRPVRILPLGDSLTAGDGAGAIGYRGHLYQQLTTAGHDVDFVGRLPNPTITFGGPCTALAAGLDCEHEGYPGFRADEVQPQAYFAARDTQPDVVLVHLGTNDLRQGQSPESTADDLRATVESIRTGATEGGQPEVSILLARIIPTRGPISVPDDERVFMPEVGELNELIPVLAGELSTEESPVVVVDQQAALTEDDLLAGDGVHPTDAGYAKMATAWSGVLDPLLIAPTAAAPIASPAQVAETEPSDEPLSPSRIVLIGLCVPLVVVAIRLFWQARNYA